MEGAPSATTEKTGGEPSALVGKPKRNAVVCTAWTRYSFAADTGCPAGAAGVGSFGRRL